MQQHETTPCCSWWAEDYFRISDVEVTAASRDPMAWPSRRRVCDLAVEDIVCVPRLWCCEVSVQVTIRETPFSDFKDMRGQTEISLSCSCTSFVVIQILTVLWRDMKLKGFGYM